MPPPPHLLLNLLELCPHAVTRVFAWTRKPPGRDLPQINVKPRKLKVSGLPSPRRARRAAAKRPNSIRRVLSGCSDSENSANRSRMASQNAGISLALEAEDNIVGIAHDDHVARGLAPSPTLGPEVEDVMQVDVGQHGETTDPCPVPVSLTVTIPSSSTPALSHFRIRRSKRGSPIRCRRKRTSQDWLTASKNDRMSASKIQFTLVPEIPTISASSASCWPRPVGIRTRTRGSLPRRSRSAPPPRPLDDLVLQSGNREWALPSVRLRDEPVAEMARPICSPVKPRSAGPRY